MSDRAIYGGFILVGFFIVVIAWLFTDGRYWREVVLGYLLAIAYLLNFYTIQVYRGKHLANWKQALARVPLRFVGYGTKEGKPLEAAHDHPATRTALLVSLLVCLALLVIVSLIGRAHV